MAAFFYQKLIYLNFFKLSFLQVFYDLSIMPVLWNQVQVLPEGRLSDSSFS